MSASDPKKDGLFSKDNLKHLQGKIAFSGRKVGATGQSLAAHARRGPLRATVLYVLVLSLIFLTFPVIDIFVAGLFYSPQEGFSGNQSELVHFVRASGRYLQIGIVIAFLFPLVAKIVQPQSRMLVEPRASLFVIGALVIGPGLLVNGILKEVWGRARPRALEFFGEEKVFTPAWVMSDQCESNCSFVSGEAASAIWLVVLYFLAPTTWRPVVLTATLCAAVLISATRILMGAHFLSDVLLAWGLVLIIILIWYDLVMIRLPVTFDRSVEQSLSGLGRRLRRGRA